MMITVLEVFTLSLPLWTHCQLSSCSSSRTPSSPPRSSSSSSWNVVHQYWSKLDWRPSSIPYMMHIWSVKNDCRNVFVVRNLCFQKKKNGPSPADRRGIGFKFRAIFCQAREKWDERDLHFWQFWSAITDGQVFSRNVFPWNLFHLQSAFPTSSYKIINDPRNRQNLTRLQVQFDNSCSRLEEDAEPN